MFGIVANEEEQVRTKYEFRKTDMMKEGVWVCRRRVEEKGTAEITKNPLHF
jgi:hypothetical protein